MKIIAPSLGAAVVDVEVPATTQQQHSTGMTNAPASTNPPPSTTKEESS